MNLLVLRFYEDRKPGISTLKFQFQDERGKLYRAEIPDTSPFYANWYEYVALGYLNSEKMNYEFWLINADIKPGTVMLEEDPQFQFGTRPNKHKQFLPRPGIKEKPWRGQE